MNLNIIYRISNNSYSKLRESYINKETCLKNALLRFPPSPRLRWILLGDSLNEETEGMIRRAIRDMDHLDFIKVELKSNAGCLNLAFDKALQLDADDLVYLMEDDYLHTEHSNALILEGFAAFNADYVSLYDHPDKYIPAYKGGNPFIGADGGEMTKLFRGWSRHWKITNTTPMTFASRVVTLREDEAVLRKWTVGTHPQSTQMFLELGARGRVLFTPLPGASTHGDSCCLSPFADWHREASMVSQIQQAERLATS